jgi:acetylornithine/succinyldiaminopimelate/putrescine aminotransferase
MPTQRELFLSHLAQTSSFPLMLEVYKARGVYMYCRNGLRMIDMISGIGVSSVGHRHPKVISAIKKQASKYLHLMVYGEFVQSPQVKLAQKLASLSQPLDSVFFVNSGSEAIEGALKLAKRYTKRRELVSAFGSYHGSSHGALSVSGSECFKNAFRPLLPEVRHIRFGNESDLELITEKTAAVLLETVQGEAGVRTATKEYWQAVRQRCNQTGALLILDEIQCGMGRTGSFWAYQDYGIEADILVAGKALGGGLPLGAFMARKEVMQVLTYRPILGHISTFGGHPLSCAAALAAIEVIERENLIAEIPLKNQLLREQLKHPAILELRGKGLMLAAQFERFEVLKPIIDRAIELGVLTDWFLFCDNAMRIAPPLTIKTTEIKKAIRLILQAIDEVYVPV